MERQGKVFDITEAGIDLLTEKGYSQTYGARFLKRHIDQKIKLPITNQWKTATRFSVDAEDGEIVIKPTDAFQFEIKPIEKFRIRGFGDKISPKPFFPKVNL
jgi:ATP-dependent Clp protease ATP-binding subunit ClpA